MNPRRRRQRRAELVAKKQAESGAVEVVLEEPVPTFDAIPENDEKEPEKVEEKQEVVEPVLTKKSAKKTVKHSLKEKE